MRYIKKERWLRNVHVIEIYLVKSIERKNIYLKLYSSFQVSDLNLMNI